MTERMRNGVIRRGKGYSYVVRERDPETGETRQRWVGGHRTRPATQSTKARMWRRRTSPWPRGWTGG